MGAGERRKGINFERFIRRRFNSIYAKAVRNYENLPGAELGTDVIAGPFKIQCKRGKAYASVNRIFEVNTNKGIPLLITKADHKPEMVVINLEAFLELLKEKENGVTSRDTEESLDVENPMG